ncbi:MAG: hypothetical protein AAF081_12260 [Actinomycetota bacterium]
MVDMAKKVNKKSELMNPRETCIAATVVMQKGHFTKSVTAGAIGGVVGAAAAAAMNKGDKEVAEGTMADGFLPQTDAILALTDQRWVVFSKSVMSGGPKELISSIDHAGITAVDNEKGKLMNELTLHFSDGSALRVEAPKANKPEELVEARAKIG